ncbi:MAG: hypothetical protein ACK5QU_04525, partial [Bacteroidota bacterium]
ASYRVARKARPPSFSEGGNAQQFFLINALILSNNDVKILVLWAICLITDKDWDDDLTTM